MNADKLELVHFRLKKANDILEEIKILIENKLWNTAVNNLYYACFHAVTALLACHDIDTKTHSGVQQQLSLHFVKENIIDKESSRFYSTLFRMRQKANYEDLFLSMKKKMCSHYYNRLQTLSYKLQLFCL